MDTPPTALRSDFFDFLSLPLELRNGIYYLPQSSGGEVDYLEADDDSEEITHDEPALKPVLGVNILRVCKQIYDEAVLFAYANRKWALRYAPQTASGLTTDCIHRLACMPRATAERIQHLGLNIDVNLWEPDNLVRSIAMGDLTKLKWLRTLELFLSFGDSGFPPRWMLQRNTTWRSAPLFVGLVCGILAQVPVHVEIVWISTVSHIDGGSCVGELDEDLLQIAQTYCGIKGCKCALDAGTPMINWLRKERDQVIQKLAITMVGVFHMAVFKLMYEKEVLVFQ